MARSSPNPLALFSLSPFPLDSERAKAVIAHPNNAHYLSTLPDGTVVLDVGFHIRGKSSPTLAVLGRGVDADIYVEGSGIARIQCSFEIDLDTGVVMLYDRSQRHSTQVFGENAMPFQHERTRKVVVQKLLNTIIGMGGERCNLVQFKIHWHHDFGTSANPFKRFAAREGDMVQNPRLAWTVDEAPTELPSPYMTRLHTPGSNVLKIRYAKGEPLGSGQFGDVHRAVDVDTGKLMAVKFLRRPLAKSSETKWRRAIQTNLKREIEILSSVKHPHIVDYIASQGWFETDIEIFMGLKEGTLESLIEGGANVIVVAETVLLHMLQALDFIACKDIIHRDVKPENILYITDPGSQYQFQLGDFGLCNRAPEAVTYTGTPIYMAPEIAKCETQSCAVDVWSLFVTLLWTLDVRGFRRTKFSSPKDILSKVLDAASDSTMIQMKEMSMVDPSQRASAAQMLVKLFDGRGLSTPRNQVPVLLVGNLFAAPPDRNAGLVDHVLEARDFESRKPDRGRTGFNQREKAPLTGVGIRKRGAFGRPAPRIV